MFGVFHQRVSSGGSGLLRGFGEAFPVPVSRHTEIHAADLPVEAGLTVLASSADAGLCLLEDRANRAVYMFNHLEYDAETLRDEYLRDRRAGKPVELPRGYFPGDDPQRAPLNIWCPYGHLLFANWLGEIYRMAWPRVTDEPVIQWALAGAQPACDDGGTDHADLLIATAGGQDILLSALGALAEAGIAPRAVKVHRQPDSRQLIEFRTERLEQPESERIARRLSVLSAVSRVAFRTSGGVGGWLVGHHAGAEPESQAPSGLSQRTRFCRPIQSCTTSRPRRHRCNSSARNASPCGDSAASAPYCTKCVEPVLLHWAMAAAAGSARLGWVSQPIRQPVIAQGLEKLLIANTASSSSAMDRKDGAWAAPS